MAVLFIEFIKMIPVSLVSCSLWHHRLQSVAFTRIVSHLHWQLFKLSILNTFKSILNSTEVCTFLSMNNFHLPVNINQRHVFCDQKLVSLHCYLHWHTHIVLSCVYEHSSELSIKRSLKFDLTVQGSLSNWTQFILYSYMCFSYVKHLGDITSLHPWVLYSFWML